LETDKICTLIMATKIPHSPADHLEEIMADADLEYLGKAAPGAKTNDLFRELQYVTPELEEAEWNQIQINFLRQHHYFTRFCQVHREPLKQAYLTSLLTTDGEP
jgi:predicted metal-dependent HD superfamily phosphohydrolase